MRYCLSRSANKTPQQGGTSSENSVRHVTVGGKADLTLATMSGIIELNDVGEVIALGGLMMPNMPFWQWLGTPQ